MYRPAPLLLAVLLASCGVPSTPAPALGLTVTALDAEHALVQLDPAPAAARWQVQPSQECGGDDGPVIASGTWPVPTPVLVLAVGAGDLVTVWAELNGVQVNISDCKTPII